MNSVIRRFDRVCKQQIPFALSQAMNDSGRDVKVAEEKELDRKLDAPTPFTKRGVYHLRASKRKLVTEIGFKRIQAEYLRLQIRGGIRRPRSKALPVPVGARRNKYGNMPRGYLKRELAKPTVFATSAGNRRSKHLAPGIYRRRKRGGPKLLVSFEAQAKYKPRLEFRKVAHRAFRKRFKQHFRRRLQHAMATAR